MNLKFGKKRFLNGFTSVCSGIGLLLLLGSISTDYWLTTHERRNLDNGTEIMESSSGLWRKCTRTKIMLFPKSVTHWTDEMRQFPNNLPLNCSYIKYFQKRSKAISDLKPTEVVLFEMQPSAIFPIISLIFLAIACACAILNQTCLQIEKMIMAAGANFVISGLALLVGIVLYVGSVSQSFDSSSNSINTESKYLYAYDISFHLTVISFVLMKLSGVVSLYHYIAISKHNLRIQMTESLVNINKFECSNHVPFQNTTGNFGNNENYDFSDRKPFLVYSLPSTIQDTRSPLFKTKNSLPNLMTASDHILSNAVKSSKNSFDAKVYEDKWGAYDNYLSKKISNLSLQRYHSKDLVNHQFATRFSQIKCSNSAFSVSMNDNSKPKFLFHNYKPVRRKITLV